MEKAEFNYEHDGMETSYTVNLKEKDVTIVQKHKSPGSKADVVVLPLEHFIRVADEANELNVRNS